MIPDLNGELADYQRVWLNSSKRYRRHPCEVTADRLMDHLERYLDKLDGKDRDAISIVRFLLQEIAEGER